MRPMRRNLIIPWASAAKVRRSALLQALRCEGRYNNRSAEVWTGLFLMKLSQLLLLLTAVCGACFAQTLPTFTLKNVIGTGTAGYDADNVAASGAKLNFPMAIARASNGTLYIADTFNQRIRTVQTDGQIR